MRKKTDRGDSMSYVNLWYLTIPLVVVLILFALPMLRMLYMSFTEFMGVGKPHGGFTLDYYAKFFASKYYWKILGLTLYFGLVSTLFCMVFGYPVAYRLSRMHGNARHLFNALTMLPLWVAITVRLFGWMNLMSTNGLINRIALLFSEKGLVLMGTNTAVLIGLIYCGLPYFIMIMTGPLENIHPSIEEASYVFGAGKTKTFFTVVVPMTAKAAISGATVVFALNTAAFVVPIMLGNGKVVVMTNLIFNRATYNYDWGFAAALSMVFMFVALVITNIGSAIGREKKRRPAVIAEPEVDTH